MATPGTTIVVGYTPTGLGEAVVVAAIDEARRRSGQLLVLNVSRGDAFVDHNLAEDEDLSALEQLLHSSAVPHKIVQTIGHGEPADEMLRVARESGASLVVIGIRQRTAVGKFLLGSTAQRIMLGAPCPVLSVKASSDL